MNRIAVVTDLNSSITVEEAKKLGVYLLNMPFMVDGNDYMEGVNCSYEEFCHMLESGSDVSTSQPSPMALTSLWDEVLKEYDSLVHIPMSSALSSSTATATALAADYEGRVVVVDNKRISISQRQSVLDALTLIGKGLSAAEIKKTLEDEAYNCSIYLAVNTLELLKKSGRVTASGAALATILGIKPVLQIQGEKLDSYAKTRGMKKAEKTMLEAIKKDLDGRFAGQHMSICAAYSGAEVPTAWLETVRSYFGDSSIEMYRLPVSISCHVSTGVLAIGAMKVVE